MRHFFARVKPQKLINFAVCLKSQIHWPIPWLPLIKPSFQSIFEAGGLQVVIFNGHFWNQWKIAAHNWRNGLSFFDMWPFWVVSHASNFAAGQIPFPRHLVWGCFNAGRDSVSKSSTSPRANGEGERRASDLLKNSSSVLWQKGWIFVTRGCEGVRCDSWPGPRWDWSFSISGLFSCWIVSSQFFLLNGQYQNWKFETRRDKKKRAFKTTFWKLSDFSLLMNSLLPINTSKHKTNMLGLQFGRFGVGRGNLFMATLLRRLSLKKRIYFKKTIHKGGGGGEGRVNSFSFYICFLQKTVKKQ